MDELQHLLGDDAADLRADMLGAELAALALLRALPGAAPDAKGIERLRESFEALPPAMRLHAVDRARWLCRDSNDVRHARKLAAVEAAALELAASSRSRTSHARRHSLRQSPTREQHQQPGHQ